MNIQLHKTKLYNVPLTLSSNVPVRTGYTFKGWSTSSTATTAEYAAGGSYTANAAATLYAVWDDVNSYTNNEIHFTIIESYFYPVLDSPTSFGYAQLVEVYHD